MAVFCAVVNDDPFAPAKNESSSLQSVTGPAVVSGSGNEMLGMMPSRMPG